MSDFSVFGSLFPFSPGYRVSLRRLILLWKTKQTHTDKKGKCLNLGEFTDGHHEEKLNSDLNISDIVAKLELSTKKFCELIHIQQQQGTKQSLCKCKTE